MRLIPQVAVVPLDRVVQVVQVVQIAAQARLLVALAAVQTAAAVRVSRFRVLHS